MPTKLIVFLATTILLALTYGYFLNAFSVAGDYLYLTLLIITGVVFLALFLIQCLLVVEQRPATILIIIQSLAFCFFAFPMISNKSYGILVFIGSALVLFIAFFDAYYRGRREITNMISIRFFQVRKTILRRAFLGLAIFSVLLYAVSIDLNKFTVSKDFFEYFSSPIELGGRFLVKDFSTSMTIGDLFSRIAAKDTQDKEIQNQVVGNLIEKINEMTKVRINLQWQISQAFSEVSNYQLKRLPDPWKTPLLIGFGIVLLLFITGFAFIFIWIIGLLSWLIYRLLLRSKFIKIIYQSKTTEAIIL